MYTSCFELEATSLTNIIGLEFVWSQNIVEMLCGRQTLFKNRRIGVYERNWGDMKDIKIGKHKGLIGGSIEKRPSSTRWLE